VFLHKIGTISPTPISVAFWTTNSKFDFFKTEQKRETKIFGSLSGLSIFKISILPYLLKIF